MVLGVVAVVEPDPIVERMVAADAPRDGLLGVAAVVEVVAVQVREAVAKIVERDEEEHELPVHEKHGDVEGHEPDDLDDAPDRLFLVLDLEFLDDRERVVAQVAEEGVAPDALGIVVVVGVAIDGNPVDGVAALVVLVAVAAMVPRVDSVVGDLRKAERKRLHEAESAVEKGRDKKGIVNKIMADAVDVPPDADGVGEAHADEHPPRRVPVGEGQVEQDDEYGVEHAGDGGKRIPWRVGEKSGGLFFVHRNGSGRRKPSRTSDSIKARF